MIMTVTKALDEMKELANAGTDESEVLAVRHAKLKLLSALFLRWEPEIRYWLDEDVSQQLRDLRETVRSYEEKSGICIDCGSQRKSDGSCECPIMAPIG